MHDLNLKLRICIQNIAVERTVSQILFIVPSSFFYEILKKNIYKIIEMLPVF